MSKKLKQTLDTRNYKRSNKHVMKKCFTSLITMEVQIQTHLLEQL